MRTTLCRPGSWANCSLSVLQLYSHGNAWVNLHLLADLNITHFSPQALKGGGREGVARRVEADVALLGQTFGTWMAGCARWARVRRRRDSIVSRMSRMGSCMVR